MHAGSGGRARSSSVNRLRQKNSEWEARLEAEGLTVDAGALPPWYRNRSNRIVHKLRSGRILVQLPHDWSDDSDAGYASRAASVPLNRHFAAYTHERLSEWLWRECQWSAYPPRHRAVLESYVIHGLTHGELAEKHEISASSVYRILSLHKRLSGA